MIYDDYCAYTKKYKDIYGDSALVLIEVGSFWELYNCNENNGANIEEVCSLLNIICSRKNKNITEISASNPKMAGFPSHALNKFLPILVENNYIVILVGQVSPPPNPKRDIIDIISKTSYLTDTNTAAKLGKNQNALMAIFLQSVKDYKSEIKKLLVSSAIIDIATGEVSICSINNKNSSISDTSYESHETFSLIQKIDPVEVLIYCKDKENQALVEYFLKDTRLNMHKRVRTIDIYDHDLHDINYQNYLFKLAFSFDDAMFLSPIEKLGYEKDPDICTALALAIRYAINQNPLLVNKLCIPQEIHKNILKLSHNAFAQLDMEAIIKLLNQCSTVQGKRYFRYRITNPSVIPSFIKNSYNLIHEISIFYNKSIDSYSNIKKSLGIVIDLEKLLRKCILGKVQPFEIVSLASTLEASHTIMQTLSSNEALSIEIDLKNIIPKINELHQYIKSRVNLDFLQSSTSDCIHHEAFIDTSAAKEKILKLKHLLSNLNEYIDKWNQNVTLSLPNNDQKVQYYKLERNDRDGFYIVTTNKRYTDTKKFLEECKVFQDLTKFGSEIGSLKLSSIFLKNISHEYLNLINDINTILVEEWKQFINTLANKYYQHIYKISNAISIIDFYTTVYNLNKVYNYIQPNINENNNCTSFVKCEDLRHPLVEIIKDDTPYIGNDITLSNEKQGFLLYGLNSSGKSTFMKSIAIALILAQAGMYVPCKSMDFYPFHSIFTRITKGDDILAGKSTFIIEISELRNILLRADAQSLVIGDELCSGTETLSATSIVASSLQELLKLETKFIFATHLHELMSLSCIKDNKKIQVLHMHVECASDGHLVYHRKLAPGSGKSTYGIEVCKHIGLADHIISEALKIRNSLNVITEDYNPTCPNRARYNRKMIITKICEVCKEMIKGSGEVHHIEEQSMFVQNNMQGIARKNKRANLTLLCQTCHDKIHSGALNICKTESTKGNILNVTETTFEIKESTDSTQDAPLKAYIKNLRKKGLSYTNIAKEVFDMYKIHISVYQIKKHLQS